MRFKSLFFTVFISVLSLGFWSLFIEPQLLIKREIAVPRWQGPDLRIAFFSDLHAGAPFINEIYISDLVNRINQMNPDLVLIGGDFVINGVVGGTYMPIEKVAELLKKLKAPLGVYSVLGNHDWWNNGDHIRKTLDASGLQVLENQAQLLTTTTGFKFWIVGIGDDFTNHADVSSAESQITTADPRVYFMHDPAAIFQIKKSFFLPLAGHMHGGQVFIPGLGAIITPGAAPKEWASGWVDFELGSLFVSKGVGTSILPIRLNAIPEFVILELKNQSP